MEYLAKIGIIIMYFWKIIWVIVTILMITYAHICDLRKYTIDGAII
jgi:hypothetical protein